MVHNGGDAEKVELLFKKKNWTIMFNDKTSTSYLST